MVEVYEVALMRCLELGYAASEVGKNKAMCFTNLTNDKSKLLSKAATMILEEVHISLFGLDFQDSPDDEEDTRSSHGYLNDLDSRKSSFSQVILQETIVKSSVSSYHHPFKTKNRLRFLSHKPELRPTKDFKAKYNKVKAKLALLSSSASASKAISVKNKGLIAEAYEWDKEEVSSDDNKIVKGKVLMALAEENDAISKEGTINGEWVKISMRKVHTLLEMEDNDDRQTYLDYLLSIPGVKRPWLSEAEGFILPNHDTGRILPAESQRNTTDPLVAVTNSSATDYDSADESLVCSTHFPPLKKLDGAEPISGPKTIKLILRSKSTFKAETLKGVKINEPSSAPAKGNKSSSASKVNSAPAGKLKSVKIKDDPPLAIVIKELNDLKLQISKNQSSYSRNNQQVPQNALQNKYKTQFKKSYDLCGLNNHLSENCYKVLFCKKIISLEREINPRNPQHAFKICKACGSSNHTTTDHYDIEWFKRGKALQAKKADALKSTMAESSNANRSKTPTKRIPNINFLYVFGCPVYIHNHKDHLGKFDEKADDGYLLGYSLVSKAFRVFNIRRQQTEETYHIIFNESPDAIKFSKPSVDNINIAKNKRYPLDEYLYPYDPSQRYQTNNNYVSFIEPYECLEPVVLETEVSSDQNCQTDQNDQSIQNDEILNDDHSEHFNHTNDEQSIDNLPNTKDI
ncbi:hypothetical protein Tco_0093123 [Tanacetum coccineum]